MLGLPQIAQVNSLHKSIAPWCSEWDWVAYNDPVLLEVPYWAPCSVLMARKNWGWIFELRSGDPPPPPPLLCCVLVSIVVYLLNGIVNLCGNCNFLHVFAYTNPNQCLTTISRDGKIATCRCQAESSHQTSSQIILRCITLSKHIKNWQMVWLQNKSSSLFYNLSRYMTS